MTTRYEWNTGRHYSPEGQRIVAEVTPDTISFFDMSRGIYGTMERYGMNQCGMAQAPWPAGSPDAVRSYVMARYDAGRYSSGAEAHAFFLRCVGYGGEK